MFICIVEKWCYAGYGEADKRCSWDFDRHNRAFEVQWFFRSVNARSVKDDKAAS